MIHNRTQPKWQIQTEFKSRDKFKLKLSSERTQSKPNLRMICFTHMMESCRCTIEQLAKEKAA
jgi:hypothetical protein